MAIEWRSENGMLSFRERLAVLLIRCGQKLSSNDGTQLTQGRILKLLHLHGPMTQKMLQERLAIQPGSMSEVAAKLERKGLLYREKDKADKRKISLSITDAGRADVEQFWIQGKPPLPRSFAALTQEEQKTLLTLLEKLYASWDFSSL
ncbi:MAG: MarR family winged helix-turn-helix transcriptional regulator [Faecousia sp.]